MNLNKTHLTLVLCFVTTFYELSYLFTCGFVIAGQSYEIIMLDNRKIGELPEITGKMVKVRFWHASSIIHYNIIAQVPAVEASVALTSALNPFFLILEHYPCGVSWQKTTVHRAPAAGRLALEQAWGSYSWSGWALNGKMSHLLWLFLKVCASHVSY